MLPALLPLMTQLVNVREPKLSPSLYALLYMPPPPLAALLPLMMQFPIFGLPPFEKSLNIPPPLLASSSPSAFPPVMVNPSRTVFSFTL